MREEGRRKTGKTPGKERNNRQASRPNKQANTGQHASQRAKENIREFRDKAWVRFRFAEALRVQCHVLGHVRAGLNTTLGVFPIVDVSIVSFGGIGAHIDLHLRKSNLESLLDILENLLVRLGADKRD